MEKKKEDYIREYLGSADKLGIKLNPPEEAILKTAEMAWVVDSYEVKPGDEPADEPKKKET
ncbi:MAG: hypothetical protein ABSA11_02710 [Candidatus Bathyarchaeia archaeon]